MKTITIITPSNIEVEYRLAGAGSRLAAFIIDFAVQFSLIALFSLTVILGFDRGIFGNRVPSGEAMGVVMVFAFLVQFGYFIVCEMATNGQSIGKRIFALRVIRDNGQPLGFSQSLVRGLLRASLDMLYIGLFIVLFSAKHKRLGDMAAGTIVVSEHYETHESHTVSHWPNFLPDQFSITPEERRLAEEWLTRREEMNDGGASAGNRLMEYFKNKYPPDETPAPIE